MKVLFLNPQVDAGHEIARDLQARGLAVLLPETVDEAAQMLALHGTSIDLVVVHRETHPVKDEDGGLKFLEALKADAAQADLPVIVTSHVWSDVDFATHQASPLGANAYLRWPFDGGELFELIKAVFGGNIDETGMSRALTQSGPVLEDAANIFGRETQASELATSIRLEAPEPVTSSGIRIERPEGSGGASSGPSEELSVNLTQAGEALESLAVSPPTSFTIQAPPPRPLDVAASVNLVPAGVLQPIGSAEAPAIQLEPMGAETESEPSFDEEPAKGPAKPSKTSLKLSDIKIEPDPELGEEAPAESDPLAEQEMPYLFRSGLALGAARSAVFSQPLGDAVVPGGAAQAPDTETLKKYLLLREQDVAVLSSQLKASKDQIKALEDQLREERARNTELSHTANEQKRRIEGFEREKELAVEAAQAEGTELRFQLKARADKVRLLEAQVRDSTEEMERLKERVRTDIRKIRVREKELENRLEIMKKDSEALIAARENKIIELKRKLDLLEFNLDLLQDQHGREKETSSKLRERLAKAAQVVRVAGGLLDTPGGVSQLAAVLEGESEDAA